MIVNMNILDTAKGKLIDFPTTSILEREDGK